MAGRDRNRGLRGIAISLRNGRVGSLGMALVRRAQLEVARRRGPLSFDIAGRMGMGAAMTHMTLALGLADRLGLPADLRCTNPLYARHVGEDWLPDFFERIDPVPSTARPIAIRNDVEQQWLGSPVDMSLAQGLATFERHFRFVPFLHAEADAFHHTHLAGRAPLGVHYRGTDKHDEAPTVARARAVAAVVAQVERGQHRAVFLATDEPAFDVALRAALPHVPLASYNRPELVVAPGEPIHFADADGYWKGVDALVNILLLARCDAVVRTASFLSGWAKVLNPAQRVLMLNRAYSGTRFPDALIESDL